MDQNLRNFLKERAESDSKQYNTHKRNIEISDEHNIEGKFKTSALNFLILNLKFSLELYLVN